MNNKGFSVILIMVFFMVVFVAFIGGFGYLLYTHKPEIPRPQKNEIQIAIWEGFNLDSDNDGLTNLKEFELGTDLENPDTDSDGIPDGIDNYPLDPTRWRSPLQHFFLVIMVVALSLTLIISFLTFRKLKNKEKKEVEK